MTTTDLPQSGVEPAPESRLSPLRWWALAVVLACAVMDLVDSMIATIAALSIQRDLGGSATLMQWLTAGYTLAMAAGLVLGGRLGDIYGRRRMLMVGMIGFTAASVLCGLAQSPESLVAFRVLQGLFGALMLPQGFGVIKEMFPPKEIPVVYAFFGPIMGLATIGGPILGGWILSADLFGLGWRAIFLINLPIGLVTLALAAFVLPKDGGERSTKLDLTGAVLVGAAALLLVYPLVQGRELHWPAWIFGLFVAAIAMFGLFGAHESRKLRRGEDPLVLPSIFRKRAYVGGLLTTTTLYVSLVGYAFVLAIYLQLGLGFSPLKAALTMLPNALGEVAGIVAVTIGLDARLGRRLIHLGAVVAAAGAVLLYATLQWTASPGPWQLSPSLALIGIGAGLALAPVFNIVLSSVTPQETGSASGVFTAVQQFGGALGAAVLGTVFFSALDGRSPVVAMEWTLFALGALLVITYATVFMLPKPAPVIEGDDTGSDTDAGADAAAKEPVAAH